MTPSTKRDWVDPHRQSRLNSLLPLLRCPASKEKLAYYEDGKSLVSLDGFNKWPIVEGRPCLAPDLGAPKIMPESHISNELSGEALSIIRETKGFVLNLSAGGSLQKFDNVVEVEYAIFRHTDIVADAHVLPFDDKAFEAVIVMNAFEHYRNPERVSAEIHRVLKPGGSIYILTAFLQPLHEKPYHFYNCTKYGMAEWFSAFQTERLGVSANFCPNHTVAWILSECESALRSDVSNLAADKFCEASIGSFVAMWRDPSLRSSALWTAFHNISQSKQEATAAGFELVGRRPLTVPILR
jgi:SAM-dependent methyltransferase